MSEVTIKNGEEEQVVALTDLAGINMDDVQEYEGGFEPTPKGLFRFKCTDAELTSVETKNGDRAVIKFEMEITMVHSLVDDGINPNDWIGRKHNESIFISDLAKSVGQAKAIMTNAGFTGHGSLQDLLDAFVGTEFDAPVGQRKDRDDPDRIYANIKVGKITPAAPAAAQGVATGMKIGG